MSAVAGALDDAAVMRGDRGIDQIAAQRPQPRQGAIFVRAGEPAVADDIGDQDRRDFPGLAHGVTLTLSKCIDENSLGSATRKPPPPFR